MRLLGCFYKCFVIGLFLLFLLIVIEILVQVVCLIDPHSSPVLALSRTPTQTASDRWAYYGPFWGRCTALISLRSRSIRSLELKILSLTIWLLLFEQGIFPVWSPKEGPFQPGWFGMASLIPINPARRRYIPYRLFDILLFLTLLFPLLPGSGT